MLRKPPKALFVVPSRPTEKESPMPNALHTPLFGLLGLMAPVTFLVLTVWALAVSQ
jgi:hypothetical protein